MTAGVKETQQCRGSTEVTDGAQFLQAERAGLVGRTHFCENTAEEGTLLGEQAQPAAVETGLGAECWWLHSAV